MTKNTCTPSTLYGAFQHTLFCGCSVLNATTQLGQNEQSSVLTVNIVQDPCSGIEKIYWDEDLVQQTTTDPDPGFTYPEVGTPAYFRIGDYEYCGIIQSWTEKKGTDGNPIYTVKLTDPRVILDAVQVIVDEYSDSVNNIYNLINAYGYLEALDADCPILTNNGVVFGSPAGGFGGANVNSRGTPWNNIKGSLSILTSAIPAITNSYSPYGRIQYIGASPSKDGYGVIAADGTNSNLASLYGASIYVAEYLLDLSEIPNILDDYRISGPALSVSELISRVCADHGLDYYIELIPVRYSGTLYKIIKVRTISRRVQPSLNAISTFISSSTGVMNNSVGRELRDESTSVFLVGGKEHQLYQTPSTGLMEPFWGIDYTGSLIEALYSDVATLTYNLEPTGWLVALDIERVNPTLHFPITGGLSVIKGPGYLDVTEGELQILLTRDFNTLQTFSILRQTKLGSYFTELLGLDAIVSATGEGEYRTIDFVPGDLIRLASVKILDDYPNIKEDYVKICDYLANYAQEFYGRQFLVQIPWVCYQYSPTERKYIWTDEPALDGAWNDFDDLLGIPFPSAASDFFSNDDGRINALIRYYGTGIGIDTSTLSIDDFIGTTGYITSNTGNSPTGVNVWVKADLNDKWIIGRPTQPSEQTAYALLKVPAPVLFQTENNVSSYVFESVADSRRTSGISERRDDGLDIDLGGYSDPTVNINPSLDTTATMATKFVPPLMAAVPIKSNVRNYGPWGFAGPPGGTTFIYDDGLTPWAYGSRPIMNAAANSIVSNASTYMRESERGQVTVPGYPAIPLGGEILITQSGVLGSQRFVDSRTASLNTFLSVNYLNVPMYQSSGLYGPNVTDININVSSDGVTTSYSLSTFTPTYGELAKKNAERLQKIGQQRLADIRSARVASDFRKAVDKIRSFRNRLDKFDSKNKHISRESKPAMLIAAMPDTGIGIFTYRDSVIAGTVDDISRLPKSGYNIAAASFDHFYAPVSRNRTQFRFPVMCTGNRDTVARAWSDSPQIPADNVSHLEINANYYNRYPVHNDVILTRDVAYSTIINSGFDVNTYSAYPKHNIVGHIESGDEQLYTTYPRNHTDLAVFAHKGPLLLKSWGYDTDGRPVPNRLDINARQGIFLSEGVATTTGFYSGFLEDEETWPCAPIDLRYDRKRGVWTTAPPIPIKYAYLDPSGLFNFDGRPYYDESGNEISTLYVHKNKVSNVPLILQTGNIYDFQTYYPLSWDNGWRFLNSPKIISVRDSGACPTEYSSCFQYLDERIFDAQVLSFRTGIGVEEKIISGANNAIIDVNFGTFNTNCDRRVTSCVSSTPGLAAGASLRFTKGAIDVDDNSIDCANMIDFNPIIGNGTGYIQKESTNLRYSGNVLNKPLNYILQAFYLRNGIVGEIISGSNLCTGLALNADIRLSDQSWCIYTGTLTDRTFFHLNFRTGLTVNEDNSEDGKYHIDSYILANGNPVNSITFNPNTFNLDYSNNCNLIVTSLGGSGSGSTGSISIANIKGDCDTSSPFSCTEVSCITFGNGLDVTANEEGYLVEQNPLIKVKATPYSELDCNTNGPVNNNVTGLVFGTGLSVVIDGCIAEIDAIPLLRITNEEYACNDSIIAVDALYRHIVLSEGLFAEDDEEDYCKVRIKSTPRINVRNDNSLCYVPESTIDATVTGINFTDGLIGTLDGCVLSVKQSPLINIHNLDANVTGIEFAGNLVVTNKPGTDGCAAIISGVGIKVANVSDPCDLSSDFSCTNFTGCITFSTGLDAVLSDGNLIVTQNPLVNIYNNSQSTTGFTVSSGEYEAFSCINFSPTDFTLATASVDPYSAGCMVTVETQGADETVEYVCEVTCSGQNQIISKTATMSFTNGLLKTASACGSGASPQPLRESASVGYNTNISSNTTLPDAVGVFATVNAGTGPLTITLPDESLGMPYTIRLIKTDSSTNVVTVSGAGVTINGASTYQLTNQYQGVALNTDGNNWYIT